MSHKEDAVHVIVVNWNNAEDTIRCLESLSRVHFPGMRVLVVDNGSTDGSADRIRGAYPQYGLLELDRNMGFGGGCNAGHEQAMKEGAEYVVFLNNDTVVDPGFLKPLLVPLQRHGNVAITVPRIYFMNYPEWIWYAGGEVNLLTGRIAHRGIRMRDGRSFDVSCETGYATGCCLAMSALDFSRSGGFDGRFSMYGEDVDLSLRIRKSGKRILYVPTSNIWHRVSASGGGELGFQRLWRKSLSLLRLFAKHRAWSGIFLYLLLAPFRMVRGLVAVYDFKRFKPGKQ